MSPDAETIRAALRCENPHCACQRPRGPVHCPHPDHPDVHPSFSVEEKGGLLLVCCHSRRCAQDEVIEALRERGLWPHTRSARMEIVATYDYRDEEGGLLYQVVRYAPKDFRPRRPDGAGGWIWNLDGVRRVPYHLHELRAAILRGERVVITEGEKDCDAVRSLGITATTIFGGANAWRTEYAAYFKGARDVVILPHNDPGGEKYATTVAGGLAGVVGVMRVLRLPGLQPKGDAYDWIAAGGTREELDRLIAACPPWVPGNSRPYDARGDGALRFTRLGDLLAEPPEKVPWLVQDRLTTGGGSLLAGKPKVGKSTLARCLVLAVARGEPWLGFATAPGLVFYLAMEEKRAEVRAHFLAMGAGPDDPVEVFIAPSPQDGLDQLRRAADARRPALIVVDPLLKFVRVRDSNDYAEVIRSLEPLQNLARETGAHVLAVHHLGKGERTGGDAILGSTAFFAAVDTALLLKRTDRYRTLASIQRYGPDLEEIVLALDPRTRWVTAGPPRQEADEITMAEAILEHLVTQGVPVEEAAVHEAVEGRRAVKVRALRRLLAEGRVVRSGQGRKGDPYLYACALTDSRILVPNIYREPPEPETKNGRNPQSDATNSSSRDFGSSAPPSESREPEFRTPDDGHQAPNGGLLAAPEGPAEARGRHLVVRRAPRWRCASAPEEIRRAIAAFYQAHPDQLPPLAQRAMEIFNGRTPAVGDSPLAGEPSSPPDGPCRACGGRRFWQSTHGPLVCATCHPLAVPALVARWWVCRPGGRWMAIRPVHQTRRWQVVSPPSVVRRAVQAALAGQGAAQ